MIILYFLIFFDFDKYSHFRHSTENRKRLSYLFTLRGLFYRKLNRFKNDAKQKIRSVLRNLTFFKDLLLCRQEAYRILSLSSLIPFTVLEIITRIANVNSITEENQKIPSLETQRRIVWRRKILPNAKLIKALLCRTQRKKKNLKSIQDFAEVFGWKFSEWTITRRGRKKK